jgi:hypothetical protein
MAVFVAIKVVGKTNLNGRTTDKILRTGFQIITKGTRAIFGFSTVKKMRARTHACAHAHTHTYIQWIHQCVTKTVECGTSDKYTNIHN